MRDPIMRRWKRFQFNVLLFAACLAMPSVEARPASHADEKPLPLQIEKLATDHLPNAYRLHPKVISGGQPAGREAFRELKSLGVRTIISVDGARPDAAAAREFGLRYVHLPHGYDGIPPERARELAKAVRDLPGPVYIHCHHGKHRSPAAATVACVSLGLMQPEAAVGVLKLAGTSEHYRGLFQSAESARRLDDEFLDRLRVEFRDVAPLPKLAASMVALEKTHEHLKEIAAAGWKSPPNHPDLDPAHEALLLREHFIELLRTDAVRSKAERFRQLLHDSEADGRELEATLRGLPTTGRSAAVLERASKSFTRISRTCTACHRDFRDVPLSEKAASELSPERHQGEREASTP
jgi:protein tyrosine phosphatase (PTP) superfamily phosphohydrolase (DUF442 family)